MTDQHENRSLFGFSPQLLNQLGITNTREEGAPTTLRLGNGADQIWGMAEAYVATYGEAALPVVGNLTVVGDQYGSQSFVLHSFRHLEALTQMGMYLTPEIAAKPRDPAGTDTPNERIYTLQTPEVLLLSWKDQVKSVEVVGDDGVSREVIIPRIQQGMFVRTLISDQLSAPKDSRLGFITAPYRQSGFIDRITGLAQKEEIVAITADLQNGPTRIEDKSGRALFYLPQLVYDLRLVRPDANGLLAYFDAPSGLYGSTIHYREALLNPDGDVDAYVNKRGGRNAYNRFIEALHEVQPPDVVQYQAEWLYDRSDATS